MVSAEEVFWTVFVKALSSTARYRTLVKTKIFYLLYNILNKSLVMCQKCRYLGTTIELIYNLMNKTFYLKYPLTINYIYKF